MPVTVAAPKKKPNVWYKLIPSYQKAWLMAYRESDKAGCFLRDQLHLPTTTAKRAITVFLRLRLCVVEAKGGGRGKKTLYRLTWIKHDPKRNINRAALSIKNNTSYNRQPCSGKALVDSKPACRYVAMLARRWCWLDVGLGRREQNAVTAFILRTLGQKPVTVAIAAMRHIQRFPHAIAFKSWWSFWAKVKYSIAIIKLLIAAFDRTRVVYERKPGGIYAMALADLAKAGSLSRGQP